STESKPSIRDWEVRLRRATRRIGRRQLAEVDIVNVLRDGPSSRTHERPSRIVHDINSVDTDLEFLVLRQSNTFHKIHIEVRVSRSLNPRSTQIADSTGSRIRQDNIPVGVDQGLVAE